VITCTLRYEIDPAKVSDFETYGRVWIHLVNRMGGTHHGYFLPGEGASDIAWAMFSFPSLAAYEDYRHRMATDPECQAAYALSVRTGCIRRYDRTFTRPVLEGLTLAEAGLA
jgi:hypothetical protein